MTSARTTPADDAALPLAGLAAATAAGGALRVGDVTLAPGDDGQTRREKLARIVLDQMYQFVGLLDAEGRTLEINRAALQGAGVRLDDIRGRPFWEARWFQVSRESVAAQQDYVRRAAAGEFIRCDLEVYGEAAGDHTIVVDYSLLPVRDQRGEIVFLLAEGRNISAKKQAEAEVARKTAELQQLLDRITQLDQQKSDMIANVSHELRTPLTLILGPAEELLASPQPLAEAQRSQLRVIQRSAVTLLKHVNDLLDLARLDSGQAPMHRARVDLAALVRLGAEQFHAIAPGRSIAYHVFAPPKLEAEVDAEKIERVLLNLLSNAFKFTPDGGRIHCRLSEVGRGRALLTVQDSGPGVPAGLERSVFERFRQAQQGTTREHGGTGLGLAIAKEFVELHGGTIVVIRAPGGGALFQVELPLRAPAGTPVADAPAATGRVSRAAQGVLAELADDEPARPGHEAAPAAAAAPDGDAADATRPRIVVVEDNPGVRRFVRDALATDHAVSTVADGRAALGRLIASPPDLVITDLMLPGLGGDRIVEEMRRHASLQDVPVLVLSAKGDVELRSRLLAGAVQDYLTKPFSIPELRARVRNLVAVKLARDALQRELASQGRDLHEMTLDLIANRHALQASERRWWAIYEHSPAGIVLADAQGTILAANPAFRRMVGLDEAGARQCTLERLTLVEDRAAMQRRIADLLDGQRRDYRVQRRFHRSDGGIAWAHTSVSVIPGGEGAPPMLVLVTEDITEQKLAERSLAHAREELARVTRASTLGELAASIAHEVNQPLAAIATNGHAALRWLDAAPPDEAEVRLAIQRIIRDANRAGEVITRIRHFLRRGESQRQPVPLAPVIDEVTAMVRAEAQAQRITLRCVVPAALPPALADAVPLQQVLLNLVVNAFEAIARGGEGHGLVTITAGRLDEAMLCVDVADTGAGLEPGSAERIFDAFHTSKPQGMGMGLAISRSIVEAHGGRLRVTPNADRGVCFRFTLPVAPPAGEEPA